MQFPDFGNYPKYENIWSESGIKAAIDIGTNTVLLLIAEVSGGKVIPILEEQRMPRLGRGLHSRGYLTHEGIESVIMVLHEYRSIISEYEDMPVLVTATSAVRDATNKMEFIWMVEEGTGYRVRLLSGQEEAVCAYIGAISQVPGDNSVCIDIGGGSTEISYVSNSDIIGTSYDVGSVRLLDVVKNQGDIITSAQTYLHGNFNGNPAAGSHINFDELSGRPLIGIAGTLTTIAALYLNLKAYDAQSINGTRISKSYVDCLIEKLSAMTAEQILELNPAVMKGREDLILMGCLILSECLNRFGAEEIIVSTGGIRHGSLLTPLYS